MIMLLMGLAIILLTMAMLGWLTFAKSENEAAIRIRTWKIRQDVRVAVEKAHGLLTRARQRLRERHRRSDDSGSTADSSPQSSQHVHGT